MFNQMKKKPIASNEYCNGGSLSTKRRKTTPQRGISQIRDSSISGTIPLKYVFRRIFDDLTNGISTTTPPNNQSLAPSSTMGTKSG